MLCPQAPWTVQHVQGKSCHFLVRSQQFSSDICDYGWELGPSLPTRDKATKQLGSPPPKEAKTDIHSQDDASIFWDAEGLLLMDYLDKGHTITGAHYAYLLRQLWEKIKQIQHRKLTRGILFHQDNALTHTSTVAMAAIQKCGFQLVEYPHHSPDVALPENEKGAQWSSFCQMMMMFWMLWTTFWWTKMAPSTICSMTNGLSVLM